MNAMARFQSDVGYAATAWCVAAFLTLSSVAGAAENGTQGVSLQPWQREVVYQIYPRSFADGNGDGIGDLRGITAKADYLQDLGIDMVWLCPVNRTTNYDNGYDVSDYLDIDPTFGTLADWEEMRDALHKRGIKVMMDLVLNHSSDAHPWFTQEIRLKTLQRQLPAEPPADWHGDAATFRSTMRALLMDITPPTAVDIHKAPFHAWHETLDTFRKASGRASQLGYPSPVEQLTRLARLVYGTPEEVKREVEQNHDFYIWRSAPNNWTSVFSGTAWHSIEATGLYYLALFTLHQPDLNWHNPQVRQVMYDTVHTWVQRGVDGFRLDSVGFIAKDQRYLDAPASDTARMGRGMQYFINQPEVHEYLRELHTVAIGDAPVRTVGEVSFSPVEVALDYAGLQRHELTEVFLFDHMYVDTQNDKWHPVPFKLTEFKKIIGRQQSVTHGRAWLANYLENHDQLRAVSRFGDDKTYRVQSATMLGTLLLTLQGTPYIYQGQEIGMTNGNVSRIEDLDDVEARNYYAVSVKAGDAPAKVMANVAARNRDNVRTVMQWDASAHGGFSKHTPWIKVNNNYKSVNVKQETADPQSVLSYYKKLIATRKEHDVLITGQYTDLLPNDDQLYIYERTLGDKKIVVMLNFSSQPKIVPIALPTLISAQPRVLLSNYDTPSVTKTGLTLRPYEARVYCNY